MNKNFLTSKLKGQKSEEKIVKPPEGCYFIHCIKSWSKNEYFGIKTPEISCSLQKDSYTIPLRPYGYILKIDKGAVICAFDRDVTSKYNENWQKFSAARQNKKIGRYSESELEELIKNTKENSHNELWIRGEMIQIIGAYVVKKKVVSPGTKVFIKSCRKADILIHWIKREKGF